MVHAECNSQFQPDMRERFFLKLPFYQDENNQQRDKEYFDKVWKKFERMANWMNENLVSDDE